MNNHEELIQEARESREGLAQKEKIDEIYDRTWVMNREMGGLMGRVDILERLITARLDTVWKAIFAGAALFTGLILYLVSRGGI